MAESKDTKPPKIRPRPVEWAPLTPKLTRNEERAATGGRSYTGHKVATWQVIARSLKR